MYMIWACECTVYSNFSICRAKTEAWKKQDQHNTRVFQLVQRIRGEDLQNLAGLQKLHFFYLFDKRSQGKFLPADEPLANVLLAQIIY